jgi:thiamine-monophosphate kinase
MDEFALIDAIVKALGDRAVGDWVRVGPGDDASVVAASEHHDIVSSIDTLVEGVHFPVQAPAELIGYRALMVSLSDLAAMAAVPRYVLVGITIPAINDDWAVALATGMRSAAERCDVYVCGGNIAQGPADRKSTVAECCAHWGRHFCQRTAWWRGGVCSDGDFRA